MIFQTRKHPERPYFEILEGGEEFIKEFYGESDGQIMIDHTDFDSLYSSIETLRDFDRYENRKLDFSEVESEFNKGSFVIILLDRSVLQGRSG